MSLGVNDFNWTLFNSDLLDPNLVKIIKTSSLIEANMAHDTYYLKEALSTDPFLVKRLKVCIKEEIQQGAVLAKWAQQADPTFNFEEALKRFQTQSTYPLECALLTQSTLRCEILRRCVVKIGTSSFYKALSEQAHEPLLKEICRRIAAEELRHYKFFCHSLKQYLSTHPLPVWKRLWLTLRQLHTRAHEELAAAYFAANTPQGSIYHDQFYQEVYWKRVFSYYQLRHFKQAIFLLCKALDLKPYKFWIQPLERGLWWLMHHRVRKFA